MHRTRSSVPYDILHGIKFPPNITAKFAYLRYFPPPPPALPGPPPSRSWACKSRSTPLAPCVISDDRNPSSIRSFSPTVNNHTNELLENVSQISRTSINSSTSSSLSGSIQNIFQNQFILFLLLIILLIILIFVIFIFFLYLYLQRSRRTTRSRVDYGEADNNNNNNELEIIHSSTKDNKFYHSLLPYKRKTAKQTNSGMLTTQHDENNLLRVINHESPVLEVLRFTSGTGSHLTSDEEAEEAL